MWKEALAVETTCVIIKPDAIARMLIGRITSKFEDKGLVLVAVKMVLLADDVLAAHYAHLAEKPLFPGLREFMTRTPVVLQAWRGIEAVRVVREIVGVTNGRDASPGSIRGDLGMSSQTNLVHASDSAGAADAELRRFFEPDELFSYFHPLAPFLNSREELG